MLDLPDKYLKPEIINMLKEVKGNMVSMNKQGISRNGNYTNTNENSRSEKYNRKKIEDKHNSRLEMIKEKISELEDISIEMSI